MNNRILLALFIVPMLLLSPTYASAVGECITGMTNIYNRACDTREEQSRQCTTRIEQTPEAQWCCCDNSYNPDDNEGGSICPILMATRVAPEPTMLNKNIRGFRDRVLAKSKRGKRYIDGYYNHAEAINQILIENPSLLFEMSDILQVNVPRLANLSRNKSVGVREKDLERIKMFLSKLSKKAGGNRSLKLFLEGAQGDISNARVLRKFGVYPIK